MDDCPAIEKLIAESSRGLGKPEYSEDVIEAALNNVLGLDTQLVEDGTYFLVYEGERLAACGGWSFRQTLFGSDSEASRDESTLDPETDAARIRAFFVHPDFARRGIGSMIMVRCEQMALEAGFHSLSLGATLPGVHLYEVHGFVAEEPLDYDLGAGLSMSIVPMSKHLAGPI